MAKTAKRCFKSHACRSPQKGSFWSWEPRPLASGRPRQTGKNRRIGNATNIATFSLATKTSWKNDGPYGIDPSSFGRLTEFADSLAKGAHVAIEGELRSPEYQREVVVGDQKTAIPQRVWEIRVDSVLKLDRAA